MFVIESVFGLCITSKHECGARGTAFVKIQLVCNAEVHGWGWKLESTVELLLHWHVRGRDYLKNQTFSENICYIQNVTNDLF